jgi:hypothetical protein
MTATQLQHAVAQYESKNGWQAENAKLTRQLLADSAKLTQNLKILGSLAQQNPDVASILNIDGTISAAYTDKATAYGLTLAAGQNPNLYTDAQGQSLLTHLSGLSDLKLADLGRKTAQLIGSMAVRSMTVKALQGVVWGGPNQVEQARKALEELKSPFFSNWMGVNDQTVWKEAVSIVETHLAKDTDSPEVTAAKLAQMDQALHKLKALSSSTLPGQLLRSVAVGYALASTLNSGGKAFAARGATDKVFADLDTLVAAAGLVQKGTSLANGLGFVHSKAGTALAKDTANGTISTIAGVLDVAEGIRSFAGLGEPQNTADGVFSSLNGLGGAAYGASQFAEASYSLNAFGKTFDISFDAVSEFAFDGSIAGGTLAAGLGLVGVGVVAVAVIGEAVYQQYEADHQYEGVGKDFLQAGGFSKAAAGALSRQDGLLSGAGGSSGVPFLMRYAGMKHLTGEQVQNWVNGLTQAQVNTLDQSLLNAASDSNGDPNQFTDGPPQTAVIPDYSGGAPVLVPRINTLQAFESDLKEGGIPLPP